MWDERYSAPGFAYGTAPNGFLASVADRLPRRGRVLSLAEGEGRNAVFLAQRGLDVTAVDASRVGLEKAARLARDANVRIETIVADLKDFCIERNAWDVVVAIFCHVPPAIRGPLFRGVVEGLRPGGLFVLEAYTPRQLANDTGGPRDAALLAGLAVLQSELSGLTFLHAMELDRDVVEGRFHTGRASVVQMLGQRT